MAGDLVGRGGCFFMLSPHLLPDKNVFAESMSRIGIWIDAVGFRSGSSSLNSWLVPIPSLAMPYQVFQWSLLLVASAFTSDSSFATLLALFSYSGVTFSSLQLGLIPMICLSMLLLPAPSMFA